MSQVKQSAQTGRSGLCMTTLHRVASHNQAKACDWKATKD